MRVDWIGLGLLCGYLVYNVKCVCIFHTFFYSAKIVHQLNILSALCFPIIYHKFLLLCYIGFFKTSIIFSLKQGIFL